MIDAALQCSHWELQCFAHAHKSTHCGYETERNSEGETSMQHLSQQADAASHYAIWKYDQSTSKVHAQVLQSASGQSAGCAC